MLAREIAEPFDSAAHLFEVKWDGYRCLLSVGDDEGAQPHLWSRTGRDLARDFPDLARELPRDLPADTVLDGEVIAVDAGRPSFDRLSRHQEPLVYVAFDCLRRAGEDLTGRPLLARREALAACVASPSPRRVRSEGVVGEGKAFFAAVAAHDLEGMMAKHIASPYRPGVRSRAWLKILNYEEGVFAVLAAEVGPPWRPVEAVHLGTGEGAAPTRVAGVPPRDGSRLLAAIGRTAGVSRIGPAELLPVPAGIASCRVRYRRRLRAGGLRHPVYRGMVMHAL